MNFSIFFIFLYFGFFFFFFLSEEARAKECTNKPTAISAHTYRYELLSSKNESWREEVFSHYHLTPTDDSAWFNLFPRRVLKDGDELDWAIMYKRMKNRKVGIGGGGGGGNFLKEVSLHDVRLEPNSIHGRAQLTNLEYLLLLDVDSLVWSFRKTAGLLTPGKPYGGWEAPSVQLRGHFVGHYLSAAAHMWASTHNDTLQKKMSAMVSSLNECQKKMGTGYLSAFPSELFDHFEAIKPVWAPYYTIHKILAGLLDQYLFANDSQALKMMVWMVDYFNNRVQNVISKYSIERHYTSLNEETGGMNDVLYKLFTVTGDPKHLMLAHLFDKPCFLGMLAVQADSLSGFHANTHIPIVIGSQMRYEVTGDPLYKDIGTFFMNIVNSSHTYATGGTSVSEFWSDPKRLANTLQAENEESCTTYNMLKVSRHLFRWTKEMAYADYYERALTNGVLSIQRGREPGVMIYMLPQGRGDSKARSYHGWGTQFDSFWCCYGTGIESFSKLGDSIYFEEEGNVGLYIIQFISSSFNWKSEGIMINQIVKPVTSWDPVLKVTFKFSADESKVQSSTLNVRVPSWTISSGAKATLNAETVPLPSPGSFLSVSRKWNTGDILNLELPLHIRTETIKDERPEYASIQAILYGPYLLAGLSKGDWNIKTGKDNSPSDWITAIPSTYNSQLISLSQHSSSTNFIFSTSNDSITMERVPEAGTDSAVHATFRLIFDADSTNLSMKSLIGKSIMLEPFDNPGMLVVQQGQNHNLAVANAGGDMGSSVFKVAAGLDGKSNSISFESESNKGCYLYSGEEYSVGKRVTLSCQSGSRNLGFEQGVSFTLREGISRYNPISFVAKGVKRNFLLMPLLSLRDESYTVYFSIAA